MLTGTTEIVVLSFHEYEVERVDVIIYVKRSLRTVLCLSCEFCHRFLCNYFLDNCFRTRCNSFWVSLSSFRTWSLSTIDPNFPISLPRQWSSVTLNVTILSWRTFLETETVLFVRPLFIVFEGKEVGRLVWLL